MSPPLLACALVVLLFLAWLIFRKWKLQERLPPGPIPIPLFGNLLSLGPLPHLPVATYTKKYNSKVIRAYFGNVLVIFISDPKILHDAYVTKWKNFSSRPLLESLKIVLYSEENASDLSFANGETWKRYRKVVASALTKSKVKSLQSYLEREVGEFNNQLDKISRNGLPTDMHFFTKRYSMNIIQSIAFGSHFSYDDTEHNERSSSLVRQVEVIFDLLGPTNYISDYVPSLSFLDYKKKRQLRKETDIMSDLIMKEIVDHRRDLDIENPTDILDMLLIEAQKNTASGLFTERDIMLVALDMYTAGTDTSSTTLQWFIYILGKYPHWQDRIFDEISRAIGVNPLPSFLDMERTPLLNAAMKECYRLRPVGPFGGLPRTTLEDDELNGYLIPKDSVIFWNLWGYAHDPDVWGDPENFRPERFLEPATKNLDLYLFGTGIRMCVAANLAQEEMYLACAVLCQRYRWQLDSTPKDSLDDGVLTFVLRPKTFKILLSKR